MDRRRDEFFNDRKKVDKLFSYLTHMQQKNFINPSKSICYGIFSFINKCKYQSIIDICMLNKLYHGGFLRFFCL